MPTYKLQLPSMGESVSEATITQWLKKVGEKVKADEPVVEVATDKVDSEIVSEHNGIIKEILCNVNDIVTVNTTIALIETDDLIEELCDVKCMIDLMIENKIITTMELTNGSNLKKLKLMKYSNLFGVTK